jgi:hypothetical protein
MATDFVGMIKQAASRQYNELEVLAFQLFDADISPEDLIDPSRVPHLNKLLDELEARVAAQLTAALIEKVK